MATEIHMLSDERVSVTIDPESVPVINGQPDPGNADFPSDEEIAAEVSRQLGRTVSVRFVDGGDHPTRPEAIYDVIG